MKSQIIELVSAAEKLGYSRVAFAKLGPDYEKAIKLLAEEIVPALR